MTMQNNRHAVESKLGLSSVSNQSNLTQIRLRIYIPERYQQEPIISRLTSEYGLIVNITEAMLLPDNAQGRFDIELRGTPSQICSGLTYLEKLQLKMLGKPNAYGDGWGY